jgi:hypothetical protein
VTDTYGLLNLAYADLKGRVDALREEPDARPLAAVDRLSVSVGELSESFADLRVRVQGLTAALHSFRAALAARYGDDDEVAS